jgi:hypothetical protein
MPVVRPERRILVVNKVGSYVMRIKGIVPPTSEPRTKTREAES